jgi:chromosome partitioning protein
MKTITIINNKGGIGKTTLAVHIGGGLATLGARVVIIDADPQAHAGASLAAPAGRSLFDLLVNDAPWSQTITPIPPASYAPEGQNRGSLGVVTNDLEGYGIPQAIRQQHGDYISGATIISDKLEELEHSGAVDVVIFDLSPTPSDFNQWIVTNSNAVILPTLCQMLDLNGTDASMSGLQRYQQHRAKHGDPLDIIGIVPNMVRDGVKEHEYGLERLREDYGDMVLRPIRNSIAVAEASAEAMTMFAYNNRHKVAGQLWHLVDIVKAWLIDTAAQQRREGR